MEAKRNASRERTFCFQLDTSISFRQERPFVRLIKSPLIVRRIACSHQHYPADKWHLSANSLINYVYKQQRELWFRKVNITMTVIKVDDMIMVTMVHDCCGERKIFRIV